MAVAFIAETVQYDTIRLRKQLISLAGMLELNMRNRIVDLRKWPENDRHEPYAAGRLIVTVTSFGAGRIIETMVYATIEHPVP